MKKTRHYKGICDTISFKVAGRQLFVFLVIFALLASGSLGSESFIGSVQAFGSEAKEPTIEAVAAILIDGKTGEVIYEKEADKPLPPASTTKMLTCIIALEKLPIDGTVEVDAEAAGAGGNKLGLVAGENLFVKDLLYGMMVPSNNDCAVAVAKTVDGSVSAFAAHMNERAKEMGATHSNFLNPSGLHQEGHVSTARDLALIAKYGMENPTFRELVRAVTYEMPPTNKRPDPLVLQTTNRILCDDKTMLNINNMAYSCKYEGATGIKTGYTPEAQACLVTGAEKQGRTLIAVVLGDTDLGRYADAIALFEYGFGKGIAYKVLDAKKDGAEAVTVKRGAVNKVKGKIEKDIYITLPKEASKDIIKIKKEIPDFVEAPVKKGQQIGVIKIYEGDELLQEVPVLAVSNVEVGGFWSNFGIGDATGRWITLALIAMGSLIVVCFFTILILVAKKKKRIKALREKKAMEIALARKKREEELEQRRWPYGRQ